MVFIFGIDHLLYAYACVYRYAQTESQMGIHAHMYTIEQNLTYRPSTCMCTQIHTNDIYIYIYIYIHKLYKQTLYTKQ